MKSLLSSLVGFCLGLMATLAWTNVGAAAPVDDLIAGAKKEGVIDFYGPCNRDPLGREQVLRQKADARRQRDRFDGESG